jgi:hypothetical protein
VWEDVGRETFGVDVEEVEVVDDGAVFGGFGGDVKINWNARECRLLGI